MVGKTSISKRFITGKFVKIDISNRTINTNIFQKCIEVNDKSFNLNIWDTAGEEKYHALGPIFYRGAHGAVVIFDVRNRQTFERATRWFHELSEFAEGNPSMILVGNKIDLPDRTITREEAVDLANKYNCKFLEVSAFLGTNVDEIFNTLAMEIYNSHKKKKKQDEDLNEFNVESNTNTNQGNKRNKRLKITNNPEPIQVSRNRKGSCC
jgi:small GTP-binding protein